MNIKLCIHNIRNRCGIMVGKQVKQINYMFKLNNGLSVDDTNELFYIKEFAVFACCRSQELIINKEELKKSFIQKWKIAVWYQTTNIVYCIMYFGTKIPIHGTMVPNCKFFYVEEG
ncbi:MAG: hypothetical protein H5T50_04990 [Nitrososphaeria archaeon]|nr:hypothetical protein [Nitrososphaeria archaeon]